MPNYELYSQVGNENSTLIDVVSYISNQIPSFVPLVLMLIFMTIAGLTYVTQEKKSSRPNFWLSCSIAGLITSTITIVIYLVDTSKAIVSLPQLIITISLQILFLALLFITGRDD